MGQVTSKARALIFLLLLQIFLIPRFSWADQRELKDFEWTLALRADSVLTDRGATLYRGYQVTPILFLGFFQNRVQIVNASIEYNDFLTKDMIRGRSKIHLVRDDPLYRTHGESRGLRNSRDSTLEWVNALEFFVPDYFDNIFSAKLSYAQDFDEHKGAYLQFRPQLTLASLWVERGLAWIEPQLFFSIGYGNNRHNQFWYGTTAAGASAITDISYGISVLSPLKFDRYFATFEWMRYRVVNGFLAQGALLENQRQGFRASLQIGLNIL